MDLLKCCYPCFLGFLYGVVKGKGSMTSDFRTSLPEMFAIFSGFSAIVFLKDTENHGGRNEVHWREFTWQWSSLS